MSGPIPLKYHKHFFVTSKYAVQEKCLKINILMKFYCMNNKQGAEGTHLLEPQQAHPDDKVIVVV